MHRSRTMGRGMLLAVLCVLPVAHSATFGLRNEQCQSGFRLVDGGCIDVDECSEEAVCDSTQYCTNTKGSYTCSCFAGYYDDGTKCDPQSYALRMIFSFAGASSELAAAEESVKGIFADILAAGEADVSARISKSVFWYTESAEGEETTVTVYGLFGSETEAKDAKDRFLEQNFIDRAGEKLSGVAIVKSPVVQTWTASPLYVVQPSGLSIENDSIHFDWSAGAWVLDFVYTRGSSTATNVLFIPRAEGKDVNGALTYDSDTQATFSPNNFPCQFNPSGGTSRSSSVCCLLDAKEEYRMSQDFELWLDDATYAADCADIETVPRGNTLPAGRDFVGGRIAGLEKSRVKALGKLSDSVFLARLILDEAEAKTKAGMVTYPSGVSYRVEIFLGLANFHPMGSSKTVDVAHAQAKVTLDKSNFLTPGSSSWEADPERVSEEVARFEEARVSKWEASVQLTEDEACMEDEKLKASVLETMRGLLAASTDGVDMVDITAFSVQRPADLACPQTPSPQSAGKSEGASALSAAQGQFSTVVVFRRSDGVINPDRITASPAVLSFESSSISPSITVDRAFTPSFAEDEQTPAPSQGGGGSAGLVVGLFFLVMAAVGGFSLYRRRQVYRTQVAASDNDDFM
mmetsp:Transcript_19571/g.46482  ORF Transcript_19571/g.46482 Transcript_19571/m.46482 type:complete len:632 (+) Transcript_19571:69-1964(+)